MAGGGPPRRGEGSRGSVTENAKAYAVGVGCVRCARAHLPFALREAPAQTFVVAVGSARTAPNSCLPIRPERSAWKKYFTCVDKFLLAWQVSRASDDGAAVGTGGARLGQRNGTPPTIFSVDDVAASAWRLAVAKPAASCFAHRCGVRWAQDMILGSTEAECACSGQLCCPRWS